MKALTLLALPLAVLGLAACGSSSTGSTNSTSSSAATASTSTTTSTTAPSSSGTTVAVTMKNLAFTPKVIHVKVGDTVTWTNDDTPPHNVTWVSGPKFTSSGTLDPGAKFSLKLTQPGVIHYYCSIHPFMKATIIVTG